jgi:hypothetical protein
MTREQLLIDALKDVAESESIHEAIDAAINALNWIYDQGDEEPVMYGVVPASRVTVMSSREEAMTHAENLCKQSPGTTMSVVSVTANFIGKVEVSRI